MKTIYRTLASGTLASLLSTLVMTRRGRVDSHSALAPLNAPSHWLHGDKALAQDDPSWRYTGTGTLIHHASAMMWGVLYDRLLSRSTRLNGSAGGVVAGAAALTAVAALVDFKLVPSRLTPGFEHRLSRQSLLGVYAAFAAGLALGGLLSRRRKDAPTDS